MFLTKNNGLTIKQENIYFYMLILLFHFNYICLPTFMLQKLNESSVGQIKSHLLLTLYNKVPFVNTKMEPYCKVLLT